VWWDSDSRFVILSNGAEITGLLLCVLEQCLRACYCVCCGRDFWFRIVFLWAVITSLLFCVLRQ